MKTPLLLPIFCWYCAGFIVERSHNETSILHQVYAHAPSTRSNPDGEDPYVTDAKKGSQAPRPFILPYNENGVNQPIDIKTRLFDWDMSCTDVGDRQRIETALSGARMLATRASEALGNLKKGLPHPPGDSENTQNQNYIAQEDPAYTQMWAALDNRLDQVKSSYDTILANYDKTPDKRSDGNGALRFVCDKAGIVKAADGKTSYCGTGATAAQAIANNAKNTQPIEPKYVFQHSATIVFCPDFFDDTKFPNMQPLLDDFNNHKTLDKIDCRERIVLHELCHLKWTINIYKPDYIGFFNAATTMKKGWRTAKGNADNYAWYALYSYWDRLPNWNQAETCKNDAWPTTPKKPNPTSF